MNKIFHDFTLSPLSGIVQGRFPRVIPHIHGSAFIHPFPDSRRNRQILATLIFEPVFALELAYDKGQPDFIYMPSPCSLVHINIRPD